MATKKRTKKRQYCVVQGKSGRALMCSGSKRTAEAAKRSAARRGRKNLRITSRLV